MGAPVSNVFYTADTHFNHPFVAGTRGFDTAEEHDEVLIENFNKAVHKKDHLWILGDLNHGSLTEGLAKAKRLNAVLHLVLGNHDPGHPMHKGSHAKMKRYMEVFESVSVSEQHIIAGRRVMLSHFPYRGDHKPVDRYQEWRLRDEGLPLLHGHVHAEFLISGRQFNVGVDFGNTPLAREHVESFVNRHD
jgi:calcineurin-like phosphoesterase family protein